MNANRVFFPQQALDEWLESGRITLVGDELTVIPEGRRFGLSTAVRFMSEVTEGVDPNDQLGKVKTLAQMQAMNAEHCAGSVILGDNAYEIIDGYVGTSIPVTPTDPHASGGPFEADALSGILKRV
jgi:hypothetical protein